MGCNIILSNDPAGMLPDWILHTPDGRFRLKRLLKRLDVYDFILIDTQGAAGPLQDTAVLAADLLISPIPPELLSAREFARGTIGMIERLSRMEDMGFPSATSTGSSIAWTARRMRARPPKPCEPCATGPRAGELGSSIR